MISFRRKILISDFILLIVFIAFLFPFVERTVKNIMRRSLESRAEQLILHLKKAPDLPEMIDLMESDELFFFQRVTLFNADSKILYDSHAPRHTRGTLRDEEAEIHPEIHEAIQDGLAYHESHSELFQESFAYVAISFTANGQLYVLRTGFPLNEIRELTRDFEKGFLLLGAFILMLYSVMTWAIIHRLSRPIQQIIDAILPYQEGHEEFLPRIVLTQAIPGDEFSKLAFTLNSLSGKIQKQIEQLVQKSRETEGILESLAEGVIALDTRGRITFANEVGCRMIGVPHAAIMGQPLDQLKSEEPDLAKKSHELVLQVLQTSEAIIQTWSRGEGKRVYLDLIAAPLAQQNGAILVLQDKTSDYKVLEMGKDFIANASHELRTPITIIRGFAETLSDLPDISKELLKDITEKIVRTCGRLDKLVKSLLTLSDIENLSDDKFRPTDLVLLTENCKHLLLTAHRNAVVTFHTELNRAIIVADGDLLDLAIMNLLENAIRYSPAPAQIDISIERVGEDVHLNIRDRGIGIPEADIPHIFDRFYTVDKARSRKSGGAGLGLSIVKTIVDKLRGYVSVSSELGKGSTFTISLPLKKG